VNKITPRLRAFIFAGLALLALVLLSASLNSLDISPGKPLSISRLAPPIYGANNTTNSMGWLLTLFRGIMIICWIGLFLYIILLFISKEERKRFLRNLLIFLPLILLLYFYFNWRLTPKPAEDLNQGLTGNPNPGVVPTTYPPPDFVPPPQWVTTMVAIGIALAITAVISGIFYMLWRQSRNRMRLKEPLKMVEQEAQMALDAIIAGGDLRETVIRCYLQMIKALEVYRGIQRDHDMTPHEFELILTKRGMPGEPIHQLTSLFEEVRYGTFRPGRNEEQTAIASLSAIISACQRVAERQG
jgi:hypothetical protein